MYSMFSTCTTHSAIMQACHRRLVQVAVRRRCVSTWRSPQSSKHIPDFIVAPRPKVAGAAGSGRRAGRKVAGDGGTTTTTAAGDAATGASPVAESPVTATDFVPRLIRSDRMHIKMLENAGYQMHVRAETTRKRTVRSALLITVGTLTCMCKATSCVIVCLSRWAGCSFHLCCVSVHPTAARNYFFDKGMFDVLK